MKQQHTKQQHTKQQHEATTHETTTHETTTTHSPFLDVSQLRLGNIFKAHINTAVSILYDGITHLFDRTTKIIIVNNQMEMCKRYYDCLFISLTFLRTLQYDYVRFDP